MSSPLREALNELADEINAVPDGLAQRAWTDGRADVDRQRRARFLATLTAMAAAALLVWITVVSGLGSTDSAPAEPDQDDPPQVVTGYPQRVVDPGEIKPLPTKGVPLTAVMHSRHGEVADGGWLALRPDGSVWSLPGLLPKRVVTDDGASPEDLVPPPALDPTGRWLAAFERPRGGARPHLVIFDVTTGLRRTEPMVSAGLDRTVRNPEGCVVPARAQLHWRPTAGEPRVAFVCDAADGRQVMVLDSQMQIAAEVVVGGGGGRLTRSQACTPGLAGWLDGHRLLDVRVCPGKATATEEMTLVEVDTRTGSAGTTELAVKPLNPEVGLLQGAVGDERNLQVRPAWTDHTVSVAWASGPDRQSWATAPDITSDAPLRPDRTHTASVPIADEGAGLPTRLLDAQDVTIYADGGLGVMSLDTVDTRSETLLVMDPNLGIDSVSFAERAIRGDVTVHRLGVRTSWWSWHPVATGFIGLGVLALFPIAWGVARHRGWRGPSGAVTITVAVLVGALLAAVAVAASVRASDEPAPLPTPGVTVP